MKSLGARGLNSARLAEPFEGGTHQPLTRFARSYRANAADRGWIRRTNYICLLVALAGGFALRANRLGAQSLWNDEGTSVALSRLSLPAIVVGAARDIHPPLYYILLHFWMALAGEGEFAVRFLSVMAGVLIIAATFRVARAFFDEEVAIIAAFLSALSAFQIYYSQETRMYIPVALWSALSALAMVQMLLTFPKMKIWALLAYLIFTIAALYTHYFSFTLVLLENAAFLTWLLLIWRRRRVDNSGGRSFSAIWVWFGAQMVVILAFLPWLAFAGNQLASWPAISDYMSPVDLLTRVLSAFVFKVDVPVGAEWWIVSAFGIFMFAGLLPSLDLFRQSAWGITFAALWTFAPIAAMYVVSIERPAYDPKFLLLATPGFLILAARGLSILDPGFFMRERARRFQRERSGVTRSLMTWQSLLTFGIVAGGALIGARAVYYDPRLQRDDYRGIADYINATATTDDAVLIDAPGQIEVFRYYYHGEASVLTLPIGRPVQQEATYSALDTMVAQYRNLYAVFWATEQADPDSVVQKYLSSHAFEASDEPHGNVHLAQYALPNAFGSAGAQKSEEIFGDEIELAQYQIGTVSGSTNSTDQIRIVHPGSILPIELKWLGVKQPEFDYKVFVHLLDGNGKIISQRDTEPVNGFRPTTSWSIGETIDDLTGLLIPSGTPAGKYQIELGLYRPQEGTRLVLGSGADHIILEWVAVE